MAPTSSSLYHVTPLHYLPHLLRDGAVYAKSILAIRGIAPRVTAKRRDRMLGLSNYLHLSLRPDTPLLADKIAKGYPHALLMFDRAAVLGLPEVALLPYNTKAWHARAAFVPVTDREAQTEMLRLYHTAGRYPSLEVLVKYGLSLTLLERIVFAAAEDRAGFEKLLPTILPDLAVLRETDPTVFPGSAHYQATTREAVLAYFRDCERAGRLLPPPEIPFD